MHTYSQVVGDFAVVIHVNTDWSGEAHIRVFEVNPVGACRNVTAVLEARRLVAGRIPDPLENRSTSGFDRVSGPGRWRSRRACIRRKT